MHPAFGAAQDLFIERIEICGDEDRITEYLGGPVEHPLDSVEVDWVEADEPGLIAVIVATPRGSVRLD